MDDSRQKGRMHEDELKSLFTKFDADKSGGITEGELGIAMRAMGLKCTSNSVKKILKMMDLDQNGIIDLAEFVEFFKAVTSADDIKNLLSQENRRFFDYKQMVDNDPSFTKTFLIPPMVPVSRFFEGHNADIDSVIWLTDTKFVSAAIDGDVNIWNISGEVSARAGSKTAPRPILPENSLQVGNALYSMALTNDKEQFFAGLGSKKDNLKLFSFETGESFTTYEGHGSAVYSLSVHPDGRTLVSGDKLGTICVHDVEAAAAKSKWEAHQGVVHSLVCNPKGTTVCTASSDGSVRFFDLRSGARTGDCQIEDATASGSVYKAIHRSEEEIISCGDDYCIKRWDLRKIKSGPVMSYFGHTSVVRTIELSPDGNFMVSGTQSGSARVWHVDELGMVKEKVTKAEDELRRLADIVHRSEQNIAEGLEDPAELAVNKQSLADAQKEADVLRRVKGERESLGCAQASLSLDGPILPIAALAWRNNPSTDKGMIACGSQDSIVRLFEVDTSSIPVCMPWDPEG